MGRGQRHPPEYPAQGEPDLEELLLARPLPRPQRHRAYVLSPEGLPAYRHALRPARHQLPRRRLHRRNRQLLVMSLDPSPDPLIALSDSLMTLEGRAASRWPASVFVPLDLNAPRDDAGPS